MKVKSLLEELESLKSINKELRREFDSLQSIYSIKLSLGHYLRLNGDFSGLNANNLRIVSDSIDGRYVYSIASFSNDSEAFRMAATLRKIKMTHIEVVKIDAAKPESIPLSDRKIVTQSMELVD